MTAWIIEDEPPALRRLTKLLAEVRPELHIAFTTDSIASCVSALRERPHPSVIFSDIHLADGLSFSIWERETCECPIIFTTAYDQYGIRAFRVNSIDYLLKPIEAPDLERALDKLARVATPQPQPDWASIASLIQRGQPAYRERFLAQRGTEWVPVRVSELRQIYADEGLTFALSQTGQRVLLDNTLDQIEEELAPKDWFRINRGQIIHIDAVRKVQAYFNHRLVLELQPTGSTENLVSRQRVKRFKDWLGK